MENLDNKQYTIQEAREVIRNFRSLLNFAERQHCELISKKREKEAELNDIRHMAEFTAAGEIDMSLEEIGSKLADVCVERREIKNLITLFFPIKEYSKNNKSVKYDLYALDKQINDEMEQLQNATYYPRTSDYSVVTQGKQYAATL